MRILFVSLFLAMTIYYVDSAAGSNTSPYDTWAKAATTLAAIAAIDVAGDTVYVASTHAESSATDLSWSWGGSPASPNNIICVDKTSGAPPTTIATGASVTTTAGAAITINSNIGSIYCYGIAFTANGNGAGIGGLLVSSNAGGFGRFENCDFILSGYADGIRCSVAYFFNCRMKFADTNNAVFSSSGIIHWNGGSVIAGGVTPNQLIGAGVSQGWDILFENFDFSNFASTVKLCALTETNQHVIFRNCKLPAGWTGALSGSMLQGGNEAILENCDSTGTNYKLHRATYPGDVYDETTLVRSGGASDGVTPLSWKMVSNANASYVAQQLVSGEFVVWNSALGSSKTLTVEFLHDNVTGLKNNEIWLEANYYGSSASPQGSLASSAAANFLATPATIASSSAAWTTTGMSNPNKQKMSVTFTPQLSGFVIVTVKLAKPSYTVYVDPLITIS